MKRKFTFLLMALLTLTGFKSWGQETITVQIGEGANYTYNLPFNSYYGYSYNEMLFKASEINDAAQSTISSGTINSISFQAYWGNSGTTSFSYDIYMKNVDRTDYNDGGWATVSESDKVKSGTITSGVNDWVELALDSPFQWDGTKNLLIVFDADNPGKYVKTNFYYDFLSFNCCHTVYSDTYNYEPSSSYPTDGNQSVVTYRPNIKLNMDVVTATTYAINLTQPDVAVGTISANPTQAIAGTAVTLSANLNLGYEFVKWTVINSTTFEEITVTNNQFSMPDSDVTVSATFNSLTQHAITVIQPDNQEEVGTFTADPTQAYKDERINLSYNLKQYDDYGYKFTGWTVYKTDDPTTTVSVIPDGGSYYYFTMPDYPVTVSAEYEQETYYALTINAENGDVHAYPSEHITAGTMVQLNQYPDAGYDFGGWDVYYTENPDNKITVEYNQFEMPAAAVTVTATFTAKELYTVSIETTGNGTVSLIDAPADNKYYEGQQVKFNVTPDAGYMINEVTYSCGQTVNIWYDSYWGYYYFTMPEAAVTINASFVVGITVHDGTDYSENTPILGSYTDAFNTKSQFIFPAVELTAVKDTKITDLIFYTQNVGSNNFSSMTWDIFMKEVDYITPSSFANWNDMTNVYNGTITISNNKLTIHLSTPFEYNGGNLMIGFRENEHGATYFYTQWSGDFSNYDAYHSIATNIYEQPEQSCFLPKTTIIYEPVVKYDITLVQPEDEDEIGTIAADMTEAAEGKTVTLSFNPKQYDDHSYRVSSWNVKKTDDESVTVSVAADNTFEMPAYPVTVSAVIEEVTYYALTVDEEIEGGSVEAYPAEHIEFGQQVELNASPAQHYKFVEWNITKAPSGDAFPVPALLNTTFNMPASALNVSATFEAYLPHTITLPEAVDEGYVTASQTEGLYCYDNVTLTVHPAEHCSLQSIVIMAGETPVSYSQDGNNYYFSMPDGDVTVTATFVENSKYNVTLVYDEEGGSITLQDGNTKYYAGDRVNLSVAANTGYILLSLEAEDSEHNPVAIANNQFTMPEDDVTVTAEFVRGITVNDGSNTNGYVPINGYNADAYTKSQFIIPESSLVDMKNGKIESMAFYLSDPSDSHTFTGNWKVYIKNVVNATTLSNYETLSAEEKVYEGSIAITNGKMTVNIPEDNQYEYRGGNLLIGFEQTQSGNWHTTNWLGVNQSSYTAYAGYTSWGTDNSQARQFLPKVTFLYEPGEPLPEYDITFHSNGIVSEQTLTEGQSLPNPTNIPAGLTFAGWTAADITTYTEVEPEYVTAARADEDLYAVFSYSEIETTSKGAGTWTKVTDVNELANNDKVVLVYSNKILGQRGSDDYSFTALSNDLTIVGDAITNIPDNAIEFTLQQNEDYWNLNYYDAKLNETTSIASLDYNLVPASFGYSRNDWTAESNSGAVVFKVTDGYTRYIGYNTNVMKVVSSSGNKCNVYKASAPVVTHYYYMTEVLTNGSITADTEVKNIIITTGTVTVDNNIVLTMNENGLFRNKDAANFVFGYGAQLITDNAGVLATMKKHINGIEWYTISSPLAASVNVTDVTNLIPNSVTDTNYDLYRFDEKNGVWVNSRLETGANPDFTTIDKGVGYIYSNTTAADVAFAGEINVTNVECNLTNGAAHGFNLIGNPFSQNIKLTDVKSDGTAVLADGFYVLNNDETWGTKLTESEIKPLQGFLVQATTAGDVTISKPTSSSKGERSNEQNTNIEMIVSNASFKDNAYAMFGEGIGLNKVSHRNAQAPMLYVPQDGEDFAIAFMDVNTTVFPLSFKAMTTGSYSISLKATDDVSTLVLVDNMTGEETNMLLEDSYTFIGSPADNENRFTVKLKISNSQDEDEHFAYQNGSELVINGEGTLQIFDVLGRVVVSEEVHGQTVNVGGLNTGAYIVRLTGESVKTQKIVVR